MQHLTSLHASASESVAALKVVTLLTGLQRLYIGHLPWSTVEGSGAFQSVLHCSRLTSLTVASASRWQAGAWRNYPSQSALATLVQLTNLVELDLMSDMRDEQLRHLMSLHQLSYLSFSNQRLSPALCQRAELAFGPPTGVHGVVHEITVGVRTQVVGEHMNRHATPACAMHWIATSDC